VTKTPLTSLLAGLKSASRSLITAAQCRKYGARRQSAGIGNRALRCGQSSMWMESDLRMPCLLVGRFSSSG
jgi:hypothetical protein